MATIIRITAKDAPRDTLVALLGRSRQGRGKASQLTKAPHEGFYYAVVDHPGAASTFQAVLTELVIGHSVVTETPGRIQDAPKSTTSTTTTTTTTDGTTRRRWTGDDKVDRAISDWMADQFKVRPDIFGSI